MSDTYQARNYTAHGGAETVIGGKLTINGTLEVSEGATISGLSANPLQAASADALGGVKVGAGLTIAAGVLSVEGAEAIADSTATTIADLKSDFNQLLAALKAASLMKADAE